MLPKDGIFDPPLILCFSAENNVPDTNYYPPRCVRSSSTKPLYRGDDAYPSPFYFTRPSAKRRIQFVSATTSTAIMR